MTEVEPCKTPVMVPQITASQISFPLEVTNRQMGFPFLLLFLFLFFLVRGPGNEQLFKSRNGFKSIRSNMAATTEQNTQSLEQEDEAMNDGKAITKDPTEVSSDLVLEEPSGSEKPKASGGEVLSLKDCCKEAFDKITEYLNGELAGSIQDYVLLEKLNKLTVTKYSEMSDTAKTLITVMEELDKKYKSLEPYLEQIDKVEESVASLEQAAYRLDAYSKRLEAKFKKLERR